MDSEIGAKTLRELCEKFDAHLVIIDSLVRCMVGEEDKSDNVRKIFDNIKKFCMSGRNDLCFIIIHHTIKGFAGKNSVSPLASLRGSSDLGAFCNVVLMFSKIETTKEGGAFAVNVAKSRWIDRNVFPDFVIDGNDMKEGEEKTGIFFSFSDFQNSEKMEGDAKKELVLWLQREEKVIFTSKSAIDYLMTHLKCSRRTVYRVLESLVQEGNIKTEKRGVYSFEEEKQEILNIEEEDVN
jgi:DNA-binding PadR family transcriptional regulator